MHFSLALVRRYNLKECNLMKKNISILLCVVSIFFISSAFAKSNAGVNKIAVLDTQKLLAKTKATKNAMIELRKKYAAQSKELEKEQRELQADIKRYNKSSDKLKLRKLESWQQEIDEQQGDVYRKQAVLEKEIIDSQNIEIREIVQRFSTIVTNIAKRDNLDIVLFKDVTAYTLKSQDITEEAIKIALKKSNKANE